MRRNVALIGFMGAGKTTVGRILAERLGMGFVETDELVEEIAGKPIPRIFEEDGEERFRELEAEAVRRASSMRGVIISCGGGVVLRSRNVEALRRTCVIVYLKTSPEEAYRRTLGDEYRPLLKVGDRMARIRELLSMREPLYRSSADIVVETDGLSPEEVADRVIRALGGVLREGGRRQERG